jgi:bacillithiol system protein YtxJ
MNWSEINTDLELQQAIALSKNEPVAFFKHSTRCSVSMFVKKQFEADCASSTKTIYLVNVITNRSTSNHLANTFSVHHESPQVLVISNDSVVHSASHSDISGSATLQFLN